MLSLSLLQSDVWDVKKSVNVRSRGHGCKWNLKLHKMMRYFNLHITFKGNLITFYHIGAWIIVICCYSSYRTQHCTGWWKWNSFTKKSYNVSQIINYRLISPIPIHEFHAVISLLLTHYSTDSNIFWKSIYFLTLEPYPKIPTLTVFGVFKDPRAHTGFKTLNT